MNIFLISVFGLVIIRLAELVFARRNTKALLATGAFEVGRGHYGLIVAMHSLYFVGMLIEALVRDVNFHPSLAGLFVLTLFARIWVIWSLGRRWTTRIIVVESEPLVRNGPYRYLKHPNYLVVALEIAVFPSIFGLWYSAASFSLLNGLLLRLIRIPAENAALVRLRPLASGNNLAESNVTDGQPTTSKPMNRLIQVIAILVTFSPCYAQQEQNEVTSRELGTQLISIEPKHEGIPVLELLGEARRLKLLDEFIRSLAARAIDTMQDTTEDSTLFEINEGGWRKKRRAQKRSFLLTELERTRQYSYQEPFAMFDFNRVDGFFFGIGTASMSDFGSHDEIGVNGGYGYSFADKRVQYFLGGEYRIPLKSWAEAADTVKYGLLYTPPTFAIGAEFHNQTSTNDHWRVKRLENAATAFFAREDFRDYYKLAGWSASIAYRPLRNVEARVEWRNDNYESRSQTVYRGRFGGNKVLPPNPTVDEGRYKSLVLTYQHERAMKNNVRVANAFGDSVEIDYWSGFAGLVQTELAHMPGNPRGFNRYLADLRYFYPLTPGLAFDNRLRFESGTGEIPTQKAQYLGGPASLPSLRFKELAGNRMLLLNTELRLTLGILSVFFNSPDLQLVLLNDFGYVGYAAPGRGLTEGFDLETSKIKYNVGVALGLVSGVQLGATWRTDRDEGAHLLLRLARPF